MSEQVADDVSHKPVPQGYFSWNEYWTKEHKQPWRTEPEIDLVRQQYLSERRAIEPDIEKDNYPFKDIKLDRADVEWLLATHESRGMYGPVDWSDEKQRIRTGLDMRSADLRGVDLGLLPLARLHAGLTRAERAAKTTLQRRSAGVHLEGAQLGEAHLEGATISWGHLENANLYRCHLENAALNFAHLEGANLFGVMLAGATLRNAYLDASSYLKGVVFGDERSGYASLAGVRWGRADLSVVDWELVSILGDELRAHSRRYQDGVQKDRTQRLRDFRDAVRANRQLAAVLRAQGLLEAGDKFAYQAQKLQRQVMWRQRQPLHYFGSLFLDVISGYGYRPLRSFITYLVVILAFAAAYFGLGGASGHALSWNEAIVVSMTAFHGRGFFAAVFQPGDLQAAVAAVEAFIGLLIEITFIATFTQRFFAR